MPPPGSLASPTKAPHCTLAAQATPSHPDPDLYAWTCASRRAASGDRLGNGATSTLTNMGVQRWKEVDTEPQGGCSAEGERSVWR